MKPEFALEVAGTTLLLLAGKAAYWPERQLLCVADAHFGKSAAYRALGQPVPHGTTAANLLRLDVLLASYPSSHLIFLGDFLHAPQSRTPGLLAALQAWRQKYPALACTLVRGNHDRRAGNPPTALRIEVVEEPWLAGPFALRHIPLAHPSHHVIAGHVHPVFRLRGRGRQSLRLPCFHHDSAATTLPSFGDFTGGHDVVASGPGERIFVTDGSAVWPVASP